MQLVEVDRQTIIAFAEDVADTLVTSLNELRLFLLHPISKSLSPQCTPLSCTKQTFEHIPARAGRLFEAGRRETKEALISGQDTVEVCETDTLR